MTEALPGAGGGAWAAPHPGGWARDFRFGEWLGDPLTPLFETWLLPVLERAFWAAQLRVAGMPTPEPTYVVVNGWYFTSLNFWPPSALGWLWQLARHPRLLRVLLQFVPPLVDAALAPWVREWREDGLPRYRALVEVAERELDDLDAEGLCALVDRLGAAAGEYFVWIALVAGAGYKTEAPLARFYRRHLFPTLGGNHQALLGGASSAIPSAAAHAVHSLDWWHPTRGEAGEAGEVGEPGETGTRERVDRSDGSSRTTARDRAEGAEREARGALARRPRRLSEFERLLATARRYAALREAIVAPFTLAWPVLRRAALRLGDRVAGVDGVDGVDGVAGTAGLASGDDVFFLTREELAGALRGEGGARGSVAARREEWERRRALVAPLRIGLAPRAFQRGLDDLQEALAPAAVAVGAVGRAGTAGAQLRGAPASAGRARGPARIIRGPHEFDRLRPGDVLVAPATAPAWTPLFARAVAVVTDTGGVLAHTSLVAREYGIPAVVGVGDATARLRDGEVVLVDGTAGTIDVTR
ncbi:MAG TPA: PEP-utilizing enzyme [Chloroflexota bacterium]|nr:PEP-utilizing enzyme [Chloroflexota bacterium]